MVSSCCLVEVSLYSIYTERRIDYEGCIDVFRQRENMFSCLKYSNANKIERRVQWNRGKYIGGVVRVWDVVYLYTRKKQTDKGVRG